MFVELRAEGFFVLNCAFHGDINKIRLSFQTPSDSLKYRFRQTRGIRWCSLAGSRTYDMLQYPCSQRVRRYSCTTPILNTRIYTQFCDRSRKPCFRTQFRLFHIHHRLALPPKSEQPPRTTSLPRETRLLIFWFEFSFWFPPKVKIFYESCFCTLPYI